MNKRNLLYYSKCITRINTGLGKVYSWSSLVLVILIMIDVIMRYVMDRSIIWLVELEVYFFAMTFILTGAYAFSEGTHVRVDLFYSRWSDRRKAWIDLLGGLFLLLPWCIVSLLVCWRYAQTSFMLREGSAQAGGLPALYILKFILVFGFGLLLLQAVSSIIKALCLILRENKLGR